MECSSSSPTHKFVLSLAGCDAYPIIPEEFLSTYLKLKDKDDLAIVKLDSDAYDKTWYVALIGGKVAAGWEKFSAAHHLKKDDELIFINVGPLRFHVEPPRRSFSRIISEDEENTPPPQRNCSEDERSSPSKFMTLTMKHYMHMSGQLHFPNPFARVNGFKTGEKITLVDKEGGTWPSVVASTTGKGGGFYLAKGWMEFCKASGITTGETFTSKFVREKGKTPQLHFFSKSKSKTKMVEAPIDEGGRETRSRKKARVSAEGEPSRRTQASHKSTVDPQKRKSKCKQRRETASHLMKQIIVEALADMRRLRSGLEIKEQKFEVLLSSFD